MIEVDGCVRDVIGATIDESMRSLVGESKVVTDRVLGSTIGKIDQD